MDIFENLENLNVSEECFEEIMDMVEGIVTEKMTDWDNYVSTARKVLPERIKNGHGGRILHATRVSSMPSEKDIKDYTEKNIDVTKENGEDRIKRMKKNSRDSGRALNSPEYKNDGGEGERVARLLQPTIYSRAKESK
jgi:hypothetical protein